jgi:hypothetical protein
MVTAVKTWNRWCGPRSDLLRAIELAANEIRASTGVAAKVEVEVEDRSELTDKQPNTAPLTSLHPSQLERVANVAITVTWDFDEWWEKHAAGKSGPSPPPPEDRVRITVTKYDTTLNVYGDDRTRVEGLRQRLADVLGHGATNSPPFQRLWFMIVGSWLATVGFFMGFAVPRWLDLATRNNRWEAAEVVGMVLGIALPLLTATGAWWLFPPIELLDEGQAGRARRFRKWIIGIVGGLILAVGGAFLYDAVK